MLGGIVLSLSQSYADGDTGSHAYHGTKGGGKVHERTGHGHSADGDVAYAPTHKDAVGYVIQAAGHHGYNGWCGILPEQQAYLLFS